MVHGPGRAARRAPLLLSLFLVAAWSVTATPPPVKAAGTISLTSLGAASTQDFDTLASSGTTNTAVPTGWAFSESGTNANTTYRAGTGSDNTGDTYSFGATGNSDRAFGGLRSGSLVPLVGAQLTNATGGTITSLAVSYTGEQWRLGQNTTGRSADRLDFQLSTDATSLTTGTWTDYDSLDFSSPVVAGTVGALNGNVAPNRTALSFSISGLSIASGATFWIRWADTDVIPGADDGLAIDDVSITPDGLGPVVPQVSVNDVSLAEGNAGTTSFAFTVSLSAPAGPGGVTFDIATSDGTATSPGDYQANALTSQTISAGSSDSTFSVLVNGDTEPESNEAFSVNVSNVTGATVSDGQGVGTIGNDDHACAAPFTRIPTIQGAGASAAITGTVTTQGVVVGDVEGSAAASGFYLQDTTGDGDAATSDGIFVFTGNANLVSLGDVVRVTGFARERFNQTTLNGSNSNTAAVSAAGIVACGTGSVAATDVTLPFANATFPERYEGMLVRFPQALVISESFNYDRFGEIVLALPLDGEPRPFSPTALEEPGAEALARAQANALRRVTLDDVQSAQNPPVLRHPNGQPFSLANRFRGGDEVSNAVGVLGWDFNLYRIFPTGPADYSATNPRPAAPEPVGGTVRVAAMNTLNYFVTLDPLDDPTNPDNPIDNICGPTGTEHDCRGADLSQPAEFDRQRDKLLQALAGLDADVIGLNELENTLGAEPLEDIVAGLPGYAYIDTGVIGTDAIKVGLIYRSSAVTPVGAWQTLDSEDDERFLDTKSRPSLAQTFDVNATGARFTVAVNHLKSKGSDCNDVGDPDRGDGQGNCSQVRRAAAEALVDWLATDPTGSGDPDVLILGDLNSYAREDAIDEILAGADDAPGSDDDFTNLIELHQGEFAYSYTFDGQAGYLDHALGNAAILGQVTGAADWHINSDEPDILDYDTSFKPAAQEALYEPNAYRTSDHDPVIVGLDLEAPPRVAPPVVTPEPSEEGELAVASATFTDANAGDTFTCTVDYGDGSGAAAGTVTGTTCTGPAHAYATYGEYLVTVVVTDQTGLTGSATASHGVVFAFRGFLAPVDNGTRNLMKAGAAVPVTFGLGGDKGLAILAAGSPTSRPIACETSAPSDPVETTSTAGSSSLQYDPVSATYTYVWKTQKAWAGTCRELAVTLVDGTTHTAVFQFTK